MIEEAVVDCYDEAEQHEAFVVMLEEHLQCPLSARVLGEEVTVVGFEREGLGGILARCCRGGRTYRLNVTALEWLGSPPEGSEWIEAYRAWQQGVG